MDKTGNMNKTFAFVREFVDEYMYLMSFGDG